MSSPNDDLRALFEQGSESVEARVGFEERLNEGIAQRRRHRLMAVTGAAMLCSLLSVVEWPNSAPEPRPDDAAWAASLEELWIEHDEQLDGLLEESDWADSGDLPSQYTIFAQLIDETDDQETIQ